MKLRQLALMMAFVLIVGAFLLFMGRLFVWRFSVGDMYPPYSSLRTDPLGAKAFYDSLARLPALQVDRHLRSAKRLPAGESKSLFRLGVATDDLILEREEAEGLEAFVRSGGRLILALNANSFERSASSFSSAPSTNGAAGSSGPVPARAVVLPTQLDLRARWGFSTGTQWTQDADRQRSHLVATGAVARLPFTAVAWRSWGTLTPGHTDWQPVLIQNGSAVVLQRSFGLGTLVISADSYPFSNEALRANPAPEFLSWITGQSHDVRFDETHFGIQEAPGAASLVRRYRLQLPLVTLGIIAILVLWRGASPFYPRPEDAKDRQTIIQGRSLSGGFVGLLRRHVRPVDLLPLCLEEWKASRFGGRSVSAPRLARVQEIVERENRSSSHKRDPVRIYREIVDVLSHSETPQPIIPIRNPVAHDH